jgi:hypothetical protein
MRIRTPRVLAAIISMAAMTTLTAGAVSPAQAGTGSLPRLNISGVYVTGASSGGYMATQLQVAYSNTFQGAGIFTAGPRSPEAGRPRVA